MGVRGCQRDAGAHSWAPEGVTEISRCFVEFQGVSEKLNWFSVELQWGFKRDASRLLGGFQERFRVVQRTSGAFMIPSWGCNGMSRRFSTFQRIWESFSRISGKFTRVSGLSDGFHRISRCFNVFLIIQIYGFSRVWRKSIGVLGRFSEGLQGVSIGFKVVSVGFWRLQYSLMDLGA